MSRRNNPSATKSVYDRDQPHATEHQPAQYRRSRSGRPGFDLRRNQKQELSARDREFAPAWRCGSCCRRRWPPSSWITIWDRRNRPPEREGEGLGLLGMKSRAREREIPGTNSSWAGYSCRRRNLGRGAPGVLCGFGLACRVGSSSPPLPDFVIVFLSD